MLYREEGFWEKEKDSPFFSRSGLKSESHMFMLLPKFRNLPRLAKSYKKLKSNNNNLNKDKNKNEEDKIVSELNKLKLSGTNLDTTDVKEILENKTTQCNKQETCVTENKQNEPEEQEVKYELTEDVKRIFKMDAERTYKDVKIRQKLYEILCSVYEKIGDYHQGEGFIIALLSIYLKLHEVVMIIEIMNDDFLKGYFSSKPKNYVRDSKVLMKLLEQRNPSLANKLNNLIVPEAFVSKWFIGFYIHIFNFEVVTDCLNYLFKFGHIFVFKLSLSFLSHFNNQLNSTDDISLILQILRLDDDYLHKNYKNPKDLNELYNLILKRSFYQSVTTNDIEIFRAQIEEEMLKEEQRRNQFQSNYEEDEIVFSDEE